MAHVDFEAAWDGPRFEGALPDGSPLTIPVQIDDLILCADCIAEAAAELPSSKDAVVKRLRMDVKVKDEQIGRLEQQVDTLKRALAADARAPARKGKAAA